MSAAWPSVATDTGGSRAEAVASVALTSAFAFNERHAGRAARRLQQGFENRGEAPYPVR
jgi:hypothetical protein